MPNKTPPKNSKNRFKRGDRVILMAAYTSRPKMSYEVNLPAGHVMKVVKVYPPDELVDKPFAMCISSLCENWYLPIDEAYLEFATPMMRLLYS